MKKTACYISITLVVISINVMASGIFDHAPELNGCSREARSLQVMYLPWGISTIARVTPTLLERIHEYEFLNQGHNSQPTVAREFFKKIGGTNFQKSTGDDIDCRWAFILNNEKGHSSVTLYFNGGLTEGFILGYKFEPDESFRRWVEDRFGAAFGIKEGL
jgi:hypothetical protein